MKSLRPEVAKRMMQEFRKLSKAELGGIKLKLDENNLSEIQATVEGPAETPFEGGEFDFKLEIGDEFPQKPPKGYFLTKIFHPNISDAGAICVSTLSSDWTEDMGLDHLLLSIKCLLLQPNPSSALNEEAGRLFSENYEDYCSRAKLMTQVYAMKGNQQKAAKAATDKTKKRIKRL